MPFLRTVRFALILPLALSPVACGKEYVRDTNDPTIDNAAMSTGLDKDDVQRMLKENLNNLRAAPIMDLWRTNHGKDTVAIFPFQNSTSEHIDSPLEAVLSEAETWLVEAGYSRATGGALARRGGQLAQWPLRTKPSPLADVGDQYRHQRNPAQPDCAAWSGPAAMKALPWQGNASCINLP